MRRLVLAGVAVAIAVALLVWLARPQQTAPPRAVASADPADTTKRRAPDPIETSAAVPAAAERTTTLTVRVVDVDRRPAPDHAVMIISRDLDARYRLTTGPDGVAQQADLARGQYRVMTMGDTWIDKEIEITGEPELTVELSFDKRAGRKLAVLVRDEQGAPIADAPVRIVETGQRGETGRDGRFTFVGLLEGTYVVSVRPRHTPAAVPPLDIADKASVEIHTGATGVITMARDGSIAGTLDGLDSGPAEVLVESRDVEPSVTWASLSDQAFRVDVPPGTYRVIARRGPTLARADASVRAGETTEVRLARVTPATLLVSARRFPELTPMVGASCRVTGFGTSVMTDERGVSTLRDVLPGRAEVVCFTTWDPEMRHGARAIEAKSGIVTEVRVDLVTRDMPGVLGARVVASSDPSVYMFADVDVDGPAAKAGIGDGDLLMTVEGVPATGAIAATAAEYATTRRPGHQLNVGVRAKHGVYVINLTVTIGKL